jgi:hypothetical protein
MSVSGFLNTLVKSIYKDDSGTIYVRMTSAGTTEGSTPSGHVTDFLKETMTTDTDGEGAIRNVST